MVESQSDLPQVLVRQRLKTLGNDKHSELLKHVSQRVVFVLVSHNESLAFEEHLCVNSEQILMLYFHLFALLDSEKRHKPILWNEVRSFSNTLFLFPMFLGFLRTFGFLLVVKFLAD